jgi:hypothetical protein
MSFQAFCPKCKKTVTAFLVSPSDINPPNLRDEPDDLRSALDTHLPIEVIHPSDQGDHRWIQTDRLKAKSAEA